MDRWSGLSPGSPHVPTWGGMGFLERVKRIFPFPFIGIFFLNYLGEVG